MVGAHFGTYETGTAFKLRSLVSVPNGPDSTLLSILYENDRPIDWGWKARMTYHGLTEHQKFRKQYHYFEGFKAALDTGSKCKALPDGFTAVQVISDFLWMLKEHCFKILRDAFAHALAPAKALANDFPENLVQWCLTVPAIWTDDTKDAMREAVWKAGMISDKHSNQLLLILEPEAALLEASVHDMQLSAMATGATVMVVDAGGRTVDLTVHTIQRDGDGQLALAEAAPGIGGFCGSTYVDRSFEKWFRERIGAAIFDTWKQDHYAEYMQVGAAAVPPV
jgi:molecular chaperone DnaK (HSP70)